MWIYDFIQLLLDIVIYLIYRRQLQEAFAIYMMWFDSYTGDT